MKKEEEKKFKEVGEAYRYNANTLYIKVVGEAYRYDAYSVDFVH